MRLFLFSAFVFYLLGLKLSTQFEIKSSLNARPSAIESKVFPELKHQGQPLELKPELIKKDSANSAETKRVLPATHFAKTQKKNIVPQS